MAKKSQPTARVVKPSASIASHWRGRFKANLAKRFFLRLHMSLILMTTGLAGFIVNRLLLWGGIESMPGRYGVSVLVGYGVFLLCIRLWLRYVGGGVHRPSAADMPVDHVAGDVVHGVIDGLSHVRWGGGSGSAGGSTSSPSPSGDAASGSFWGTGSSGTETGHAAEGTFWSSGGGSSTAGEAAGSSFGSWGDGGGDAVSEPGDAEIGAAAAVFFDQPAAADTGGGGAASGGLDLPTGGSGGGGGGWDFDLGDDAGALVAVLALVVIVIIVCGAGAYLIWEAPMILSDAAFQVVMTWAVRRRAGEIDDAAWVGSVVKATVWPFVVVLVLTVGVGWGVQAAYPDVHSLGQLMGR